jgi:Ca-activated chloride channel homolog
VQAAGLAADRGVRVYTVGIGTPEGQQIDVGGWKVHVRLDEATLKKVSEITRGEYFHAASASELKSVYQALNSRLSSERVETEMTAVFSAGAAMLTTLAGLLSLLWFNRFVS